MIAKSAMDESWTEEIGEPEGRVLVILEGLVMYFPEAKESFGKIVEILRKTIKDG